MLEQVENSSPSNPLLVVVRKTLVEVVDGSMVKALIMIGWFWWFRSCLDHIQPKYLKVIGTTSFARKYTLHLMTFMREQERMR